MAIQLLDGVILDWELFTTYKYSYMYCTCLGDMQKLSLKKNILTKVNMK